MHLSVKIPILSPSILSYDNCNLLDGVRIIESGTARWIHVDIMDGHFVENISFGPKLVTDLRKHTNLFLDVHLMLENSEKFVEKFISAGASAITVHQEANCSVKILSFIKQSNCLAGLAVNPETIPDMSLVKEADIVLVMGVRPGSCGQNFIGEVLKKISSLNHYRIENNLPYKISIDGGVSHEIIPNLIECGVDIIVSGSSFFKNPQKFYSIFPSP